MASKNLWISQAEIMALPTSGAAWNAVKSAADNMPAATGGHTSTHDVYMLALAYVAIRLNDSTYLQKAQTELNKAIGTDTTGGSGALSISRNLCSYVVAADVVALAGPWNDAAKEANFRSWVKSMLTKAHASQGCADNGKITVHKCSIIGKNEVRPNNHGSMAGASRAAADIYIGLDIIGGGYDVTGDADLVRTNQIFRGYVGDRAAYSDFKYGDLFFQSESLPVGINPQGATISFGGSDYNADGIQPDDQRRTPYTFPAPKGSYPWEALQGLVVWAHILRRAGYDAFNYESQAILRAVNWLTFENQNPLGGDDKFQAPLLDFIYGTSFWNGSTVGFGKNMGWTDWTHSGAAPPVGDTTPPMTPDTLTIIAQREV